LTPAPRADLDDASFAAIRELVEHVAGIQIPESKRAAIAARIRRDLVTHGGDGVPDWLRVIRNDVRFRDEFIEGLCTHETSFFREPAQFRSLEMDFVPRLDQSRIRVWSAGCSTGEEPFSIAMMLLDRFPVSSGVSVEVVATDLSRRALEAARKATWSMARAPQVPERYRKLYLLRGVGKHDGEMRATEQLRSVITFERLNLNDPVAAYLALGTFDFVFCRNVLIYFTAAAKRRAIAQLIERLAPSGVLLLGHSERLSNIDTAMQHVGPNMYRRRDVR